MKHIELSPEPLLSLQPLTPADRAAAIAHHIAALEELAEPATRGDGWTPFARRLFLQLLAETGRVTTACDFCGLTKQSAYALRARDPIFAAGWDAACELARMPLADALYEQALDGLTDTITRDDGRTVTRHRFDSRLSIAVLNRLDRRCDRAAEHGSPHRGAVRRWDEFVAAIGGDDQAEAKAILAAGDSAQPSQASQLRDESTPDIERVWWDEDEEEWRTDFPAPPGFDGFVVDDGEAFERTLTAAELELVERNSAAGEQAERDEDEAERDAYFAALSAEDGEAEPDDPPSLNRHPGPDPGSTLLTASDQSDPPDEPKSVPLRASASLREPPCPSLRGGAAAAAIYPSEDTPDG